MAHINNPNQFVISLDPLDRSSPDARSTPHGSSDSNQHASVDNLATMHSIETASTPNQSEVATLVASHSGQHAESTCSSADIYKMRAHGNRGDRSPTVI